ncbi:MAG: nucleotidyltransferase family protein [Candidatus Omnitrophota bacterium]|nr:nucleotidyltransferase family protein [Candidatus Omnitrophota bacterium]
MKALILAAGYGTRLYPLTKEYPKPLLEVGRRPLINYILDKIKVMKDVNEIIVVTNSKFISQFRKWRKPLRIKKQLALVDDLTKNHSDKRGAVGDIDFVIEEAQIKDDLLVIGGDNLFKDDLKGFISFADKHRPYPVIGIYRLKNIRQGKHYGIIKLDAKNRIIDFKEKPKLPKSNLAAMCLYFFPKQTLGLFKEYLCLQACSCDVEKSDATGFYIDWLRKKLAVYGFIFSNQWYDIGDYEFYKEAREQFRKVE